MNIFRFCFRAAVAFTASGGIALAQGQGARRLSAGDPQVNGALLPARSDTVRNAFLRDGVERSEGWVFETLINTTANGEPALLRVVVGERDRQTDSILVQRQTLKPIWHRWHSPRGSGFVEYRGTHITGRVMPKDSVARTIDVNTPVPAYDGETIGLVRAALPFAIGYAAGVPVFDWQSGFQWRDVTVSGQEAIRGKRAWRVTSVTAAGDRIDVFVDAQTRATLLGRITMRAGGEVRMAR